MAPYTWYLFLLPLINLLIWPLVRARRTIISLLPTGLLLLAFLVLTVFASDPEIATTTLWAHQTNGFEWKLVLRLAPLPVSLVLVSCFISLLIQVFSLRYLSNNQPFGYYFFLMGLFTTAMCALFLAGNLFTMLLGWELVGICSYLLVQFWYQSDRPVQAGFRVLMINKVGDIALIAGLGLLLSFGLGGMVFNQLQIPEGANVFFNSPTGIVLCLFFVLAALVKSAQFPFNFWLKEAMEGPTTVSALLHSATMVVAGLWVLIQLSPMFGDFVWHVLIAIGCVSLLISSIAAVSSSHFKSVLAFSTLMQLALLTIAIGLGKADEASVHILTHAFFKASLFLSCGWAMHRAAQAGFEGNSTQFLANLKGCFRNLPFARWSFAFCAASLAGIPLTSGYISKEALLPDVFHGDTDPWIWAAWVCMQAGILATAFYCIRLVWWLCFLPENKSVEKESTNLIFGLPILFLSVGAGFWVFGLNPFSSEGWLFSWLGFTSHWVHLDVGFLVVGLIIGWLSIRKGEWDLRWKTSWVDLTFVDLKPQNSGFQFLWKMVLQFSSWAATADKKLIERPIDLASKATVVGGHFLAFTDKKIVDGAVVSAAGIARWLGTGLWYHSKNQPQYVVYFVTMILGIISWFWLF